MPTQAQIEFFARWNETARRADREADLNASMARRLDEAARLSEAVGALRETPQRVDADAERP